MIVNEEAVKNMLEKVKPATLVAATKYIDEKEIEKLEACGCLYFGENRVQAFLDKYEQYRIIFERQVGVGYGSCRFDRQ